MLIANKNALAGNLSFMYIVGMNPINFTSSKAILYAPLAGISDSVSRKIARRYGADATFSELISSDGLVLGGEKTLKLAKFTDKERPIGLQIFGSDPERMAEASKILEDLNPDFIDINFGCPARKVIAKNGGSSALKDLKLVESIITKVVKSVNLPITVKMRSGWDNNNLTYLHAGEIIEESGAKAITLHPRTRSQMFSGKSDWSQIADLKENLNIPIIGNGDILTPEDAKQMFEQTNCDAIMIGRGSIGNPWIFKRAKEYISSGNVLPEPSPEEKISLALEHFKMMLSEYGVPTGIYKMRSRFCWYLKGLPKAAETRKKLMSLLSYDEIISLLNDYKEELEQKADIYEYKYQ